MRLPYKYFLCLLLPLTILFSRCAQQSDIPPRILIFSKTEGYRHACIPVATAALRKLCVDNGIAVDTTEDA